MASNNTINTDINITIIKRSERGAYLITDGVKQAWTRPASRREDGTWTPSAYKALQISQDPYITPEEQARINEERKQAYLKERQEEHYRQQKPVYLIINPNCVIDDNKTGKCYKVTTGNKVQSPFKRRRCLIAEHIYVPKSQVNLIVRGEVRVFEIPTWLYESNSYYYSRIGTLDKD